MVKYYKELFKLSIVFMSVWGIIACATSHSQNKTDGINNSDIINSQKNTSQEFQSYIKKPEDNFSWTVRNIQSSEKVSLEKVFFIDATLGYAIVSANSIFKTSNGGISWKKISSFGKFAISDIYFITNDEGFATLYYTPESSLVGENSKGQIIKTEDGGHNWKVVYTSNSIILEKLNLSASGIGVAVGMKVITAPQLEQSHSILITKNKGQIWTDISEKLNQIAANKKGFIGDNLEDLIFSDDKGIIVLSRRGSLYNTNDEGNSWNLVSRLAYEPEACMCRLGRLDNGKFWVAGGTSSGNHGTWGMIAINQEGFIWDKYRLQKNFFSDAIYVSNEEIFAIGSIVEKDKTEKGVVFHSLDSGKSWSIIYESQTSDVFNSIFKFSEQKIYLTGKNGEIVILEKSDTPI